MSANSQTSLSWTVPKKRTLGVHRRCQQVKDLLERLTAMVAGGVADERQARGGAGSTAGKREKGPRGMYVLLVVSSPHNSKLG